MGIAAVSSDPVYLDGLLREAVDFIDNMHLAEMTDCRVEMIHLGEDD